jgi:hypothetical protein
MNMRTTLLAAAVLAMGAGVMLASPAMAGLNNTDSGFWTIKLIVPGSSPVAYFCDKWIIYPQLDKVTMDATHDATACGGPANASYVGDGYKVTVPKGVNPNITIGGAAWMMSDGPYAAANGLKNLIWNFDIKHSTWDAFEDSGSGLVRTNNGTQFTASWTPGTYSPPAGKDPSLSSVSAIHH